MQRAGILWLVVVGLAGCGGSEKKLVAPSGSPAAAPVATSETTTTGAPADATTPVSPSIAVSAEIARACQLRFGDVSGAPRFEFDESDLLPADQEILAKIGECLTTGPLKGRAIELVGRTDPRGSGEYNFALGARRAHSVAAYLARVGVASAMMTETSRGELDASGTDEAGWQNDRRVDIVLAR